MSLIESVKLQLGEIMPSFSLPDPEEGVQHHTAELMGKKGLIVVFTCNHCPYAKAIWPRLIRLARAAGAKGVATVAINPNIHPDYPEDSPAHMREKIRDWKIGFPYLVDADQKVANAYSAQCTPDIYLLDPQMQLAYHGQFDDNWKDESSVKHHSLQDAVDKLVAGQPPLATQKPSLGCSIKWLENG